MHSLDILDIFCTKNRYFIVYNDEITCFWKPSTKKLFCWKYGDFLAGGVSRIFFRVTLKAFIRIRMTVWTIQNDYFDHVRHVWDIFGTIRPLKIIFWDYIFENFRLKMNKNTFFGLLWLYKGNYYLFKLRNEEFRCLRSEYMTIIIS